MGIDSRSLPDNFLRRIDPTERKRIGLPPTIAEATAASEAKNERHLQQQIIDYLRLRDITGFRANPTKKSTIAVGHPDIWFCFSCRACALEVKLGDGKLTEDQERMIARMRSEGWLVEVARSIVDARRFLDGIKSEASGLSC